MKANIVSIGDELLIGHTINTNAAFLGRELSALGFTVNEVITCSDTEDAIAKALEKSEREANFTALTGGLGPTKDDITKYTLCRYFKTELKHHPEIEQHIKQLFETFGRTAQPINLEQANLPAACIPLTNQMGTASGMWFARNNKVVLSMPGIPYEMKHIFTKSAIPKLKEHFNLPEIVHTYLKTAAVGESTLADKVKDIEDSLPQHIKLAYLPTLNQVKLRLSGYGESLTNIKKDLFHYRSLMEERISPYVFGYDGDTLPQVIGQLLQQKQWMMATAESCTGGKIAHTITQTSGSSAYFNGGIVAYANAVKTGKLSVNANSIKTHGAVSETVVRQMLHGVLDELKSDVGIAVSGIMGPGGERPNKPIGMVWVAVGSKEQQVVKELKFGSNRANNIQLTTVAALKMAFDFLNNGS